MQDIICSSSTKSVFTPILLSLPLLSLARTPICSLVHFEFVKGFCPAVPCAAESVTDDQVMSMSMSMSMTGFAARGNAVEGSYFRKEQELALRKQLERLVGEGQLPPSALQQPPLQLVADVANRGSTASTSHISLADVPVSVLRGRPEYVYQHVKGAPGKCVPVCRCCCHTHA